MVATEWVELPLGSVITLQRGFDLPYRNRRDGSVPVVTSSGSNDVHNEAKVKAPGVVTGRYGTIGEVFYITQDFWPHNTTLFVSDFKGNEPLFIYYLLHTLDFKTYSGKSGVPGINRNDVHEAMVYVPSRVSEQRAIAKALSEVDDQIDALDDLIAKKRDLKQGAMQRLLTGEERLPGFSGEWEAQTIEDLEKMGVVRLSRGKVISKKDVEHTPGNYPIYSSSVQNMGLFGHYGKYMFDEELITWSVDGGGDFFYRPKHRFSVTNVCGFMRVNTLSIDYKFLAAQLQVLHSRMKFDYQTKAHPSVIRKAYRVLLPRLDEQRMIAETLYDIEAEIIANEEKREKTVAIKQGMMQELLMGKTRLV